MLRFLINVLIQALRLINRVETILFINQAKCGRALATIRRRKRIAARLEAERIVAEFATACDRAAVRELTGQTIGRG